MSDSELELPKPKPAPKPAPKPVPKLDRSAPYGTVHGGGMAKFEQDGKLFDAKGNLVK